MFCRVAGALLHAGKNVSFRGFFIVAGRAKVPRGLSEPGCIFTGMGVMAERAVACIDGAMFEQSAHDIAMTLKTGLTDRNAPDRRHLRVSDPGCDRLDRL